MEVTERRTEKDRGRNKTKACSSTRSISAIWIGWSSNLLCLSTFIMEITLALERGAYLGSCWLQALFFSKMEKARDSKRERERETSCLWAIEQRKCFKKWASIIFLTLSAIFSALAANMRMRMMGDGHMVHVCANADYKLAGDDQ